MADKLRLRSRHGDQMKYGEFMVSSEDPTNELSENSNHTAGDRDNWPSLEWPVAAFRNTDGEGLACAPVSKCALVDGRDALFAQSKNLGWLGVWTFGGGWEGWGSPFSPKTKASCLQIRTGLTRPAMRILPSRDLGFCALCGTEEDVVILSLHATEGHKSASTFRLTGHETWVRGLALSSDESTLCSACDRGDVMVWSITTGQSVRKFVGKHSDYVRNVAYTTDGRCVLSACDDGVLALFDLRQPEPVRTVNSTEFPVGNHIPAGNSRHMLLSVAVLPNDMFVTGDSTGLVSLWDPRSFEPVATQLCHSNWIRRITARPDAMTVMTASDDRTALLIDMERFSVEDDGVVRAHVEHEKYCRFACMSPADEVITVENSGVLRIWPSVRERSIIKSARKN